MLGEHGGEIIKIIVEGERVGVQILLFFRERARAWRDGSGGIFWKRRVRDVGANAEAVGVAVMRKGVGSRAERAIGLEAYLVCGAGKLAAADVLDGGCRGLVGCETQYLRLGSWARGRVGSGRVSGFVGNGVVAVVVVIKIVAGEGPVAVGRGGVRVGGFRGG